MKLFLSCLNRFVMLDIMDCSLFYDVFCVSGLDCVGVPWQKPLYLAFLSLDKQETRNTEQDVKAGVLFQVLGQSLLLNLRLSRFSGIRHSKIVDVPLSRSNCIHFHALFWKFWPNDRLVPSPLGVGGHTPYPLALHPREILDPPCRYTSVTVVVRLKSSEVCNSTFQTVYPQYLTKSTAQKGTLCNINCFSSIATQLQQKSNRWAFFVRMIHRSCNNFDNFKIKERKETVIL